MSQLTRCSKCITPETHETITFNQTGVCSVCVQHERKQTVIDWSAKKKDLDALVEQYRGKYAYDCIVPYSGGKDSVWTLYYLVKEYGLKPLVVRFDHGFLRPNLHENTQRILRKLGVAFHHFTPNWKVVQKLMLQSFLEKGDFCWHCHTGIFSYPMWVAIQQNVPLIFWGEPSAEYTSYYNYDQVEEVDETRFNRFVNLGITAEDMAVRLGGEVDERDLKPFSYPPIKELKKLGYRSLCLGSFVPWDVKKQVAIIQHELGWKGDEVENVPPEYNYEKIECQMQGVRDYIKFLKRGYARVTQMTALDLRKGELEKAVADRLVQDNEGRRPPSLDLFLDYLGLSEPEFNAIVMKTVVAPHEPDFAAIKPAAKLHDYDTWYREKAGRPTR